MSIYVSDRHFGIGSDGLITIGPSDKADFRMRIYNADGSEAEMCGNGIRCVAKYVYDHKLTDKTEISVETGAGIKYLTLYVEENRVSQVRVDMGEPILTPGDIPVVKADGSAYGDDYRVIDEPISAGNREWHMTCVSMGNPHAVVFVDDVAGFELEKYGPLFENHKMFPKRTNTEFVEILSRNEAKMRVWERGSAETLYVTLGHDFRPSHFVHGELHVQTIGHALMSSGKYGYVLPFEVISILLLACIVGGILIARKR